MARRRRRRVFFCPAGAETAAGGVFRAAAVSRTRKTDSPPERLKDGKKEKDGFGRLFLSFVFERGVAVRTDPVRCLRTMGTDVRAAVGADHRVLVVRSAVFTYHTHFSLQFQYVRKFAPLFPSRRRKSLPLKL